MDENARLGLFLFSDKAVAVWISSDGENSVLHTQCITPVENQPTTLAIQAARAVIRQGYAFDEVFVAIDCGCYTQFNLHSEFNDYRQIESTIKFDAEEAATVDAMNLAVAFEVTDSQPTGSQVTTYTADRQLLTDILLDLQEGGLDPTYMEPDVVCLGRALEQMVQLSQQPESLFVVLAGKNCYMLRPTPEHAPIVRTFLIEPDKDVTSTLMREILLAVAAEHGSGAMESVVLIGDTGGLDTHLLAQRTGLKIRLDTPEKTLLQTSDSNEEPLTSGDVTNNDMTPAELLIAYGAAIAGRGRGHNVDFRKDFMPYQGKRKVMEGSLRLIGISMTVLLLAVAIFFQLKALSMKGYASRLENKNMEQYRMVLNSPLRNKTPSEKLEEVYKEIQDDKNGLGTGDNTSVPAKLTFFLEALNNCPKNADININQIDISERTMSIKGDTNNRTATNALINQIKKHPQLTLGPYQYKIEGNRDTFDIDINPAE